MLRHKDQRHVFVFWLDSNVFLLFCKNVVFVTYEESHDVTRCVMLNGVPMFGPAQRFILRRRGWRRPRGRARVQLGDQFGEILLSW